MNKNYDLNSVPCYTLQKFDIAKGDLSIARKGSYSKISIGTYSTSVEAPFDRNAQHGLFNSEDLVKYMEGISAADTRVIDKELSELEIKANTTIYIQIELIFTVKLTPSFLIQIMTASVVKAAGYIVIFAGLTALTTALIALIPVIAAALSLIHVSNAALAFNGSILFTIGSSLYLSSYYCQNKRVESEKIVEIDVTMEQLFVLEPQKKSFSTEARDLFFNGFYSVEEIKDDEPLNEEDGLERFILP